MEDYVKDCLTMPKKPTKAQLEARVRELESVLNFSVTKSDLFSWNKEVLIGYIIELQNRLHEQSMQAKGKE